MIRPIGSRRAFQQLQRHGVRVRLDPLWCIYLHDPETSPPGVAFAIGRAVGNAVTRNRLRRRMRSVLVDSDVPPGLLLIGATPAAVELTYDQIASRLGELLGRLPSS